MQFMWIKAACGEQYDILYRVQLMLELRTSYACDDESQIVFCGVERVERLTGGAVRDYRANGQRNRHRREREMALRCLAGKQAWLDLFAPQEAATCIARFFYDSHCSSGYCYAAG